MSAEIQALATSSSELIGGPYSETRLEFLAAARAACVDPCRRLENQCSLVLMRYQLISKRNDVGMLALLQHVHLLGRPAMFDDVRRDDLDGNGAARPIACPQVHIGKATVPQQFLLVQCVHNEQLHVVPATMLGQNMKASAMI